MGQKQCLQQTRLAAAHEVQKRKMRQVPSQVELQRQTGWRSESKDRSLVYYREYAGHSLTAASKQ